MHEGWHSAVTADRTERHYFRGGDSLCGRRVYFGDDFSDNAFELGADTCRTCEGLLHNKKALIYVCPACNREVDIKAVRASTSINEVLTTPLVDGEPLQAEPLEVKDWVTLHYECSMCGHWLPVEPAYNDHGDGALIGYLKKLPYNQEKHNG